MAIDRDKTKPVFEDFIIDETGDWQVWLLAKGDPCGKLYFRIEKKVLPSPNETYEVGFDVFHQQIMDVTGWRRLGLDRPDLASWFKQFTADGFPRCEDCNKRWRDAGCR